MSSDSDESRPLLMETSDTRVVSPSTRPVNTRNGENTEGARRRRGTRRNSEEQRVAEEEEQQQVVQYGAKHVTMLFAPVSLCMLLVVIIVNTVSFYTIHDVQLAYAPFKEDSPSKNVNFLRSLYNALIILGVVVVMTTILILLYKYKCYKIIRGWLFVSSLLLLFFFTYIFFSQLLIAFNAPVDYLTMGLIIWNFGFIGMLCIFWKGPLRMQQLYLIAISALMALTFIKYLPEWTTWVVLAVIALWDLIAVLTPCGPLKILVETAREREEPIMPALIYSSTATILLGMADRPSSGTNFRNELYDNSAQAPTSESEHSTSSDHARTAQRTLNSSRVSVRRSSPQNQGTGRRERRTSEQSETPGNDEERGVKLGLGDFIFYSLLVGRASSYGDWNTTLACFVAILVGLSLTLLLLAIFKQALPALPISIAFGLVFYFGTRYVISPFLNLMAAEQVYL